MSSITERLIKKSTIKSTNTLVDSKFFKKKDLIQTSIPILNLAQSGEIDGGFGSGLTLWAGPSKHFKTSLMLANIKAFLDKYPKGVCLFYDSEFGTPQSYFTSFGIPLDRVIHSPITDIEVLKFDIITQLEEIQEEDKVFIAVDSVGNLASKKELEDAKDGKSVTDMTRAKSLKGLFRMVTPYLTIRDIPMHVVNHTYQTQEMYSKAVVSGGTGIYYSADNIFIIGRQQNKDGTDVLGYNFVLNVEKSRFVREKSKLPITVSFEKGISKWSGLLELALQTGHVIKPSNGWYQRPSIEDDRKWRILETDSKDFWIPLITKTDFPAKLKDMFQLSQTEMLSAGESVDYETGEITED